MVGTTTNKISYTITSGSSSPLSIPFRFDAEAWVYVVAFEDEGSTVTNLVNGTDYTLGGDGVSSTGTLTLEASYLSGVTDGTRLVIYRIAPALQTLDLQYNTRLPAEALETAIDVLAMANIDRSNISENAWTFPLSDPDSFASSYQIPPANERKGLFPIFQVGDGKPAYATAEDVAQLILPYFGDAPTAADVLAAISASSPLELSSPPTTVTQGLLGQIAILPASPNMQVTGSLTNAGNPIENPLLYYQGIVGDRGAWQSGGGLATWSTINNWWLLQVGSFPSFVSWTSTDDVVSPDLVTTWTPGINAGGTPSLVSSYGEARAWMNFAPTGEVPNWIEIITQNSFTNLPTSDPAVAGRLFLSDTTVLNISQG